MSPGPSSLETPVLQSLSHVISALMSTVFAYLPSRRISAFIVLESPNRILERVRATYDQLFERALRKFDGNKKDHEQKMAKYREETIAMAYGIEHRTELLESHIKQLRATFAAKDLLIRTARENEERLEKVS